MNSPQENLSQKELWTHFNIIMYLKAFSSHFSFSWKKDSYVNFVSLMYTYILHEITLKE